MWPEIWENIGPLFHRVVTTGEGTWSEDELLPMHRHGYTEECYFNFTISPIRGEGGRIDGLFNACIETTYRATDARRTRLLRELGETTTVARSPEEACILAADTFGQAPLDVTFSALYLVDARVNAARLAAVSGIARASSAVPPLLSLSGAEASPAVWPAVRARPRSFAHSWTRCTSAIRLIRNVSRPWATVLCASTSSSSP